MRPPNKQRSGKRRIPKDDKGVATFRGRTCEQVVADLRMGLTDRKTQQGQLAVKHLLEQAALVGGKMVYGYHTSQERLVFAFLLGKLMLITLGDPTGADSLALEVNFPARVGLLMRRIFTKASKSSKQDAMTRLSGSDFVIERVSDGVNLEDRLIAELDERARLVAEACLGWPAADILRLHDQGMSNSEIAKVLKVSEGTVRYHLRKHRPEAGRRRKK